MSWSVLLAVPASLLAVSVMEPAPEKLRSEMVSMRRSAESWNLLSVLTSAATPIVIPLLEGVYVMVMFSNTTAGLSLVMVKPTVMSEGLPSLVSTPMGALSIGVRIGGTAVGGREGWEGERGGRERG